MNTMLFNRVHGTYLRSSAQRRARRSRTTTDKCTTACTGFQVQLYNADLPTRKHSVQSTSIRVRVDESESAPMRESTTTA